MMQFESLASYIDASASGGAQAGVPIPMVADYLDKTPAAVRAMMAVGRLQALVIGKSTMVSVPSILKLKRERDQLVSGVYQLLVAQAKAGIRATFYDPVMRPLALSTKIPADRRKIGEILGLVSDRSFEEQEVLLSVLVHAKSAGVTKPSPSFFDLARSYGLRVKDEDAFVHEHTDKVIAAYG